MSPLELMQRLAALVPRLRLHLIRFHGVLAPNASLRPLVVPQALPAQAQAATEPRRPRRVGPCPHVSKGCAASPLPGYRAIGPPR
jgi:hypothetical protein